MIKWLGILLAATGITGTTLAAPPQVAVFRFELIDTSGADPKPGHAEWLDGVTQIIQDGFVQYGFPTSDLTPAQAEIEDGKPLYGCNGCFLDIAKQHQWDWAVVGVVRKVSELILGMQVMVFEAETEQVLFHRIISFRGDNWKAWERAAKWLVRHKLKKLKS